MSEITFKRVTPHESRIYQDGDHVGDVYRQDDILDAGNHYYVVHLDEDSRGPVRPPHSRAPTVPLTRALRLTCASSPRSA